MALPRIPTDLRGRELWLMLARDQVGRQLLREVDGVLLDAFKEVTRRLLTEYRTLGPRQADRLAGLFRQVSDVLAERYGHVSSTLTTQLERFGGIESAIAREELRLRLRGLGNLDATLGSLTRERIVAIADVLVEGRRMPEWWQLQARKMAEATRRQVQIGLTLGESTRDVVKRILPPKGSVEPAVYRQARQDATTLVRTAVTAVSAEAQSRAYASVDPRISDRWVWTAVRDARTSDICRALDGQVFRYDDPTAPRPPAHFGCRSVMTPQLSKRLGIGESEGPGGWRDYESWLRAQPEGVQQQTLGPGRWPLWHSGKVTLQDMVDRDGRTLTLAKLRELVASRAAEDSGLR